MHQYMYKPQHNIYKTSLLFHKAVTLLTISGNKKITTKSGKRGWILRLDKGTKPLYRFFQGYAAKAPMYHTGENIKEYIKEQLVIDLNRGE